MATLQTTGNAASSVYPGGTVTFKVQFETFLNTGLACEATGVTIAIAASGAADGGAGTPLADTSAGVRELGMGLFQYTWDAPFGTAAGSYIVTWTGTRASDDAFVAYTQAVTVVADPAAVPLPGCYASVAQYRAWSGDLNTPSQRVTIALQRASEQIDVALVAAVYRTDADGMPLDPSLTAALSRATSAQAQYVIAANDDANIKREYASTSVGGVSASRAAGMQALALPPIAPQALAILRVEGVLPASPLINW
jgi:hypothetical protein